QGEGRLSSPAIPPDLRVRIRPFGQIELITSEQFRKSKQGEVALPLSKSKLKLLSNRTCPLHSKATLQRNQMRGMTTGDQPGLANLQHAYRHTFRDR
ncbi:MAG: hypothetical protein QOH35_3790, partial [Acidobacteriaceae bacterium]|nr:hypothetical protein [Acidobacteriaceae bacterium]